MQSSYSLVNDVMSLEGGTIDSIEDAACVMQRVINDGNGWRMQGSMGRSMMEAIRAGECMLGKVEHIDYYNNTIPSRYSVKDGTSGSRSFVVKHRGEEWAAMLEAAETP